MRVLITCATGLIGTKITQLCHENGLKVSYLSTSKDKLEDRDEYRGFYWNPSKGEIDTRCLERVGTIINLAGASVFQPWTKKAKARILNSRVDSLNLLYKTLKENDHEVGQLISASAIGIYESSLQKMHTESDKKVDDSFLGKVSQQWETAANQFNELGLRVAIVRIGLVLSDKGGALAQMKKPFKYNLGTALGSGKQWQSWIHIEDLARIFIHILQNGLNGVYNAVAPNPVTNKTLTQQLADIMGKKTFLPNVPAPVLKLSMGEMSQIILSSQLVSCNKIIETGFTFHYINLERALRNLINEKTGV
jgi:uncharacterized protein (TIGR01777 family)